MATLWGDGQWYTNRSIEIERRHARLTGIIQDFLKVGCYTHEECQMQAECLASEIIARERAWS